MSQLNYYTPQPQVVYLHSPQPQQQTQYIPQTQSEQLHLPKLEQKEILVTLKQQEFSTGLCDCCVDIPGCLFGCVCPCWLFGKNVEHINGKGCCGSCMCYTLCCGPCNHSPIRRKLRLKHNIQGECNDFCTVLFCPCCALCQESREIIHQIASSPQRQYMK